MAWARRMDESPNPSETRNGGRDWAVFHHLDEKRAAGGLVGFMARDALSDHSDRVFTGIE
jgi:hypothetical protein